MTLTSFCQAHIPQNIYSKFKLHLGFASIQMSKPFDLSLVADLYIIIYINIFFLFRSFITVY